MRFITTRRRLDTPPRTIINYLQREWVYEIFRGAAAAVYISFILVTSKIKLKSFIFYIKYIRCGIT